VILRFQKSAAVVVGTFNIYIVQPKWLAEIGVLPVSTGINVLEADLNRPGFRFGDPNTQRKWNVRPDRIFVESESPEDDCGAPLAEVLRVLQWTPVMAVGTNAIFRGSLSAIEGIANRFGSSQLEPPAGYDLTQRTWHVGITRGSQVINLQLATLRDRLELSINVHTELPREAKQPEISRMAQEACSGFLAHRKEAVDLVEQLLGIRASYEYNVDERGSNDD
jgi:hypothetical protein